MKKTIIRCSCIIATILLVIGTWLILWLNGIFIINEPEKLGYTVKGVDVSSYQGEINWEELSKQDIQFAFIKATEGSSYVDEYFQKNYENAQKTDLRIGAYHFFSYDSSGSTQADNFIKNVAIIENMLPPVIDIEFYANKESNLPDVKNTQEQLQILIDRLKEHYNLEPIIYATNKSYNIYIANNFENNPIWIRDVFNMPNLKDGRDWTFWQYTDKARLKGYSGKEEAIDLNVFYGTYEEFMKM